MRYFALILAVSALAGCTWETYQKAGGGTALRQKYQTGTGVYYQDGTYSRNMRYNQFRPEQHAVLPEQLKGEVRGTHWPSEKAANKAAE